MKYLLLLIGFCTISGIETKAQTSVVSQPANRVINIDGNWRTSDSRTLKSWYVVSERNNNTVYSDENCMSAKPGFTLSFGEVVYVLEYKPGKSILVAKPGAVNASKKFIGNDETDAGWVKEESMVLSRYCIRTENNPLLPDDVNGLYTKKVFIFNTPGTFENPPFYSHPSMKATDRIGSFDIYTIFYVYKEEGNKLLLGQKPEQNSLAEKNLIGWVEKKSTSSWNHNMCLEKNWYDDAVNERSGNQISSRIFSIETDALTSMSGGELFIQPILYNEANDERFGFAAKRIDGNMFRSPIINTLKQDSLYEVGFLSRGAEEIEPIEREQFFKCFRDLIDQLNTINMVFLIDGTHSILPYKETIVQNLQDAFTHLTQITGGGEEGSKIKLKYNAFIYRDDPYPKPFSTSGRRMTSNFNEIISFIDKELVNPGSFADDLPEAMYWGFKYIDERLTEIRPFEKTFVIVIGDVGDHQRANSKTFLKESQVLELLEKKNYSVSAIQVAHKTSDPSYNAFQTQFKSLLNKYYREKYNKIIPSGSTELIDKTEGITRFPHSDQNVPSMLIYPKDNSTLSNETLGRQLRDLVINAPMADFNIKLPCNIPENVLTYLDLSTNDPEFERKALYGMLNFYYVKGFAPQYSTNKAGKSNTSKLYNDVQFFKTNELKTIEQQLKVLIPDNNSPSTVPPRTRLFNAWKFILVEKLKVVDDITFPTITLQEAALFLTQNEGRKEWANIRMMDLNTSSLFSDEMLGEYYFDWFTTKIMIQSILVNSNNFSDQTLSQHSDVFKYCYNLLSGKKMDNLPGFQQQVELSKVLKKAQGHFTGLNYANDAYIKEIARCRGEILSVTVNQNGQTIGSGDLIEVFWVSGEFFPHDNNFAKLIFKE
jgi:hypothetical protein